MTATNYPAFAFPGGYPIVYVLADGESLCAACANGENGSEALACADDPEWRIVASGVHWEGEPETCAHCGGSMPSAYGGLDD